MKRTQEPVPPDEPDTHVDVVPELGLQYVGFNARRGPFANELIRKAFSHAIDRELFAKSHPTMARPATRGGAIPPAMPAHSHRIGAEYDPERARTLLEQAGYPARARDRRASVVPVP